MSELDRRTWISGLVAHQRGREARRRARALQENLVTLILGTLAAALGLVVCLTWAASHFGGAVAPWCARSERYLSRDLVSPPGSSGPDAMRVRGGASPVTVVEPTRYSTVVSLIGSGLAVLGLLLGRRHHGRGVPALCVLALVLCWLPMLGTLAEELLVEFT